MTTSFHLGEDDLKEAVNLWLQRNGHIPSSQTARVYLGTDPGDPPLSGPTIYANAFTEGKAA